MSDYKKIRYVVHPDDEIDLLMDVDKSYSEISVIFNTDAPKPFITQVEDRLTIADHSIFIKDEYVIHPLDEEDDG